MIDESDNFKTDTSDNKTRRSGALTSKLMNSFSGLFSKSVLNFIEENKKRQWLEKKIRGSAIGFMRFARSSEAFSIY